MCGATSEGVSLDGVDLGRESVIQGVVTRGRPGEDGEPVTNAYVRLLDRTGEFAAEVPTTAAGEFRFFAAPGEWTVRTLAPRADIVDRKVLAQRGVVAEVAVAVG